ncbi:Wnt inhibitory factor 1 [Durusdinium trenchii]|uniref:Wnt inhibitory factor 1 n=1 Tax=Durusdinium trenchii TaxID=1381693 RepID=A0ABP0M2J1_9DINO
MAMSLVMRRIGALGLCTNCCPEVRTLTDIPRGLWPVMSFYAELQQRQDATELLETVRWYVDAAAANYRSLNRQLRHGGRLQKAALGHRQRLDQLAKIAPPLLEPLTLWRGFSSLSFVSYLHHLQKVEDDEDGSQSKDVKDDAYMSCSLSHSIGNFYARRHAILPEDLDDAVLLRIQVPAGAQIICVACCSGLDHEEEILLPRGSVLRIDRIDQLDHKNGPANGQVTAILTAEATLLAGAGANTSLDSRKSLRRVSLYALPPDSAEELTTTLHVADPLDVARQFRLFPTKAGLWRLRAQVILLENITVDLSTWPIEVLPGLSSAHRAQALPPQTVITNVPFDVPVYSFDEYENPVETGTDVFLMKMTGGYHGRLEQKPMVDYLENNTYMVQNLFVVSRDLFQLHIDLMSLRHNNSLSQCPELSPVPGGEIYQLSEQRAIGSRATLRCYSGFAQAGGEEELLCEWPQPSAATSQVAGYAEWFNLSSMPASGLMCRERPLWCPVASPVHFGRLLMRDWRRQVGSVETMECIEGHVRLLGDLHIVCGSRHGEGTWLAPDGTKQIPAACMPLQNFCPPLDLNSSFIWAASHGRDPGSVVKLRCQVGLIPSAGDSTLVCGSDGIWRKPIYTLPQPLSEVLSCAPHPNFCSDPSPLLLEGAIAHMSEMHLNATVLVTCAVGYEPSGGEDMGLCGIHPEDDSRGGTLETVALPLEAELLPDDPGFRLHPSLVCI